MKGLNEAASDAITTNGWTSRATESFITITAHYMTKDWSIANPVLQTQPLPIAHTGENTGAVLSEAVQE